ncbi:MAG: nucleotidyl transferase AbiEii/AbiGii toxin family protein [bacterium]
MKSINDILNQLQKDHDFVLMGGIALKKYGSPRPTLDIDIAINPGDVDGMIGTMIDEIGAWFVQEVVSGEENKVLLTNELSSVRQTLNEEKPGYGRFIISDNISTKGWYEVQQIPDFRQFDLIWDNPIPFGHLKNNARELEYGDTTFLTASPEDLLDIKRTTFEQRGLKSDCQDIQFLEDLIEDNQ